MENVSLFYICGPFQNNKFWFLCAPYRFDLRGAYIFGTKRYAEEELGAKRFLDLCVRQNTALEQFYVQEVLYDISSHTAKVCGEEFSFPSIIKFYEVVSSFLERIPDNQMTAAQAKLLKDSRAFLK